MDAEKIINELEEYVQESKEYYELYVEKVIVYKKKQSELWLDTDFKQVLENNRPTVDEKKAFVNFNLLEERKARDDAYYHIEYLKQCIDVCYAKLSVIQEE